MVCENQNFQRSAVATNFLPTINHGSNGGFSKTCEILPEQRVVFLEVGEGALRLIALCRTFVGGGR